MEELCIALLVGSEWKLILVRPLPCGSDDSDEEPAHPRRVLVLTVGVDGIEQVENLIPAMDRKVR